ncbi:hypothetical protein AHF37_10898 [Paragonimus kellicotti]|nr:hypothetical protein AHF37_10898 [Paragonimus kellicotti]
MITLIQITCSLCITATTGAPPITTTPGSAYQCLMQTKFIALGSMIATAWLLSVSEREWKELNSRLVYFISNILRFQFFHPELGIHSKQRVSKK